MPSTRRFAPPSRPAPGCDGPHAPADTPATRVRGYGLTLQVNGNFLGDLASQTAFRGYLDAWRRLYRDMGADDPFDRRKTTRELSKRRLDELLEEDGDAAALLRAAMADWSEQLAEVLRRFKRQPSWRGVERIVVGGGFQQSRVGELAVARTARLLRDAGLEVRVRTLRHHADDGGLVGWVHLAPPDALEGADAFLAVDIGGTNVRCGIVELRRRKADDFSRARVLRRAKWCHRDDGPARTGFVDGLAGMLAELVNYAERKQIALAPFVGVACPGLIGEDGRIASGTQNLPGDWQSPRFHLASELCARLPKIDGRRPEVRLHNDAVVQGLSERPFIQDVRRWAVVTAGTGLGNASYLNRRTRGRSIAT
ncbi:ROK family protein [Xylophilus sp.]|uniref:ROK family protein n=1 Tax=Xylophilus sp. TaxID=2653893 RepID=UPI0013BA01D5|nr:ROK family protein [Xylophilus sp.]KAF1045212.1 MAG: hypothetical protein GAK38_03173 [Xylophilus sp.]